MYPIRVSTKALIYRDETILCSHYKSADNEWYIIPGGGVNGEETAEEGNVREVMEETGYAITVNELVFVREFIPSRLGGKHFKEGFHQIELFFLCSLENDIPMEPTEHDNHQIGCEWIPLSKLEEINFFPTSLKTNIRTRHFPTKYVGNVG